MRSFQFQVLLKMYKTYILVTTLLFQLFIQSQRLVRTLNKKFAQTEPGFTQFKRFVPDLCSIYSLFSTFKSSSSKAFLYFIHFTILLCFLGSASFALLCTWRGATLTFKVMSVPQTVSQNFLCRFGFKVLCGELPFKHSGSEVSRAMVNSFKFSLCGWELAVVLKSDAVYSIGDLGCGRLEV